METEEMTVQVLQMLQWWVAVCFDQEGSELAPLSFWLTSFKWVLFLYLISFSISYLLNHTANLISQFFFYHDLETFFIHPNFSSESFTTESNNLNETEIKLKTLVICKYCARHSINKEIWEHVLWSQYLQLESDFQGLTTVLSAIVCYNSLYETDHRDSLS